MFVRGRVVRGPAPCMHVLFTVVLHMAALPTIAPRRRAVHGRGVHDRVVFMIALCCSWPQVSCLDWETGRPNAKYWSIQMAVRTNNSQPANQPTSQTSSMESKPWVGVHTPVHTRSLIELAKPPPLFAGRCVRDGDEDDGRHHQDAVPVRQHERRLRAAVPPSGRWPRGAAPHHREQAERTGPSHFAGRVLRHRQVP